MDADRCTCLPVEEVLRGRAEGTREECPVHPTPPNLIDLIKPQIHEGCFGPFVSFSRYGH